MSDYSASWPLWGREGQLSPDDFNLPEDLVTRLEGWQELFEERFHYDRGWRSPEDATAYAAEGRQLQHLLTREIGEWAHVELDLWPVTPDQ